MDEKVSTVARCAVVVYVAHGIPIISEEQKTRVDVRKPREIKKPLGVRASKVGKLCASVADHMKTKRLNKAAEDKLSSVEAHVACCCQPTEQHVVVHNAHSEVAPQVNFCKSGRVARVSRAEAEHVAPSRRSRPRLHLVKVPLPRQKASYAHKVHVVRAVT